VNYCFSGKDIPIEGQYEIASEWERLRVVEIQIEQITVKASIKFFNVKG